MSIAMLSAISLICIDAAAVVAPLVATPLAAAPTVVAVQAAADTQLTTPPSDEIERAILPPAIEPAPVPAAAVEEEYSGPLAFEGESDAAVAQRFVDYLEQTTSLTGDFTQIAPSGAISTGRIYLRRPGLLRFEYDPPDPLLIVANGGLVYVYDDALETTDSYPLGKTPLKFLLSKKLNFDETSVVGVDRGVNNVAITLASKKDDTEGELTIIVKAPEMTLIRWIVRDLQGGITVVTLDNVVAGERLANRLFRPPDAGGAFLKN
jgi:outer membrane lipoprotein-sorting protein